MYPETAEAAPFCQAATVLCASDGTRKPAAFGDVAAPDAPKTMSTCCTKLLRLIAIWILLRRSAATIVKGAYAVGCSWLRCKGEGLVLFLHGHSVAVAILHANASPPRIRT